MPRRARVGAITVAGAVIALVPARAAAQSNPSATLTPTLAAQLRLTESGALGGEADPVLLELRRLRPGLRARALDGRLTAALQLNTTPSSLELLDLWVEYRVSSSLSLRAGQAKATFTAYRQQSFTELAFVDWALVTRPFGAERQLGVELHNRAATTPLELSVGVWSGTPMRSAHGAGVAAVYGEAVTNLSDLRAPHVPDAPHPDLTARLAWHPRRVAGRVDLDLGLNATVDLRPVAAHDLRAAFAPEAAVTLGRWRLDATAYVGVADLVEGAGVGALFGLLVEARLRATDRITFALRYARTDASDALREDARLRAERIIRDAPAEQQGELGRRYADAGSVASEQELTGAVVVRVVGSWVTWQSDLGWLRTTRAAGAVDGLRGRTQVQVVF